MVNDEFIAPQCPRKIGGCGPGLWNELIAHTLYSLHHRFELQGLLPNFCSELKGLRLA